MYAFESMNGGMEDSDEGLILTMESESMRRKQFLFSKQRIDP